MRSMESTRMQSISTSASMAVSQAAKEMARNGIDVVDLSVGEPDFDTPPNVVDAGLRAIRDGRTRYTAPAGTLELRDAIAHKLLRDDALAYDPTEITVGNGAKQIIFNALLATLEPGDEVIVLAPYFVSYPDMIRLAGGKVVVVPCSRDNRFRPRREDLQAALTPRTRWIILNSPGNPSGAVFTAEELQLVGEVVAPWPQVLVMSDEIYETITYPGAVFTAFAAACPELRDRTLTVNGLSKSHAMTGWRIGYGAGPAALVSALTKLQSQSTTNACSISQAAAVEALLGDQTFVTTSRQRYQERRGLLVTGLADVPLLEAFEPEGAFYVFAECSGMIGTTTPAGAVIGNDADAAAYLLREGRVAGVPGAAYGMEPHVRLSLATSEDLLLQALARLADATARLTDGHATDEPTLVTAYPPRSS